MLLKLNSYAFTLKRNLFLKVHKSAAFDLATFYERKSSQAEEERRLLGVQGVWLLFISGYANAKIYECENPKCPRPGRYISGGSSKDDSFPCLRPVCSGRFQLVRHVSFVDCPGHDILMATMLNGAAVMDAALLLIGKRYRFFWCWSYEICLHHLFPKYQAILFNCSWQRIMPAASNVGALGSYRNYET